jgi:hypothetical protein
MKNLKLISFLLIGMISFAQVGIGTNTPHSSALLDVVSTNKGVLLPKVNLLGKNDVTTIPNPVNGLLVFNQAANGTDSNAVAANTIYFWQNSLWQKFTTYSEIIALKQTNQFVLRSSAIQAFTNNQVNNLNTNESNEVVVLWGQDEISIDNPTDIQLLNNNRTFRINTEGEYRILSNFSFNPAKSTTTDNSNFTSVTFVFMKSTDAGNTWNAIAGTTSPYDVGVSNATQTIILPPTIVHLNVNDRIRVVVVKPELAPTYGNGAGILKNVASDYTKYLRMTRVSAN